jgi:hypothetical protein
VVTGGLLGLYVLHPIMPKFGKSVLIWISPKLQVVATLVQV